MAIFDPSSHRIRIDAAQLADALAKRVQDADQVDLAKAREVAGEALRDAADLARDSFDRTAERARSLVARLERELPDTDKDRYDRAYARGRVQARSIYLAVGIAAGVTVGIAAAALLDPRHGPRRRARIAGGARGLACGLRERVTSTARLARERAMTVAEDRGLAEPDVDVPRVPSEETAPIVPPASAVDQPPVTLPAGAVPVMVVDPAAVPATDDPATAPS